MKYNIIEEDLVAELSQYAALAEILGKLPEEQLAIIYKEKWFNLFVPTAFNGLQLSLIEGLQIEEDLARIDGSLGWTVTLCAGASLFVGYINSPTIENIFSDTNVCFGGSGAITGKAQKTTDGYIVSGRWCYATGSPHLTVFTANCMIEENGEIVLGELGQPVYRSFFFIKDEVTIVKEWDMMGLKATAGDGFKVDHLWIPDDRCFEINAANALLPHPIYRYPFMQLALLTLTVNMLGMGINFIETCEEIFCKKRTDQKFTAAQYEPINLAVNAARATIVALKKQFYIVAAASWQQHLETGVLAADTERNIQQIGTDIVSFVKQTAIQLYPYCGVSATKNGTTVNRIFCDIFTASQHALLVFEKT